MKTRDRIAEATRRRLQQAASQRKLVLKAIREGHPLDAETDEDRKLKRIQAITGMDSEAARRIIQGEDLQVFGLTGEARAGAERILGKKTDFMGVSWIDSARGGANAVGRVVEGTLKPLGSGVLISHRLFLTNNHLIEDAQAARELFVELDYELDANGQPRPLTRYTFDPDSFFLTSPQDDLDFTIVALGKRVLGRREVSEFGYCPLFATADRHLLGEFVNIVQHPEGDYKQVVIRENRLVTRLDTVLHYMADTLPGSSGSPVFNDQWALVALHHWGTPFREVTLPTGARIRKDLNEGIRISAIVRTLQDMMQDRSPEERRLLQPALRSPGRGGVRRAAATGPSERTGVAPGAAKSPGPATRLQPDGAVTWTIPLELSMRLGASPPVGIASRPPAPGPKPRPTSRDADGAGEALVRIDTNYANRRGYDPDFLKGFHVELPRLSAAMRKQAARKLRAAKGEDPFELKYQHFSVVMNAKRRMAFFTACNIDGSTWVNINRASGEPREAAEAAEVWFEDPRISPDAQSNQDLYDRQRPRTFDRGHLVRRQDPTWGTSTRAQRANADTFHFTNCTPQVSRFNQRAQYWQGIERWLLEDNAVADRERIIVFTGPVFGGDDPKYRSVQVPRSFWKIVVFVQGDQLRATAVRASQEALLPRRLPERMGESLDGGAEDLSDTTEIHEYRSTVAEIERLTGLNFGPLRRHDTNAGNSESRSRERELHGFDELGL
ncbi:DNA/RNA non-specific endonuclease [Archangium sp. Cb G35]|uniref:DNA/RNA non-specific endonuclease n=1 Tax=Archangium sp. Cb G35 TaxID=1920190 RepID=UPI000936D85C|nr:DNA/RNA non-specific endonuclease [Archangium sp. Cb G35]